MGFFRKTLRPTGRAAARRAPRHHYRVALIALVLALCAGPGLARGNVSIREFSGDQGRVDLAALTASSFAGSVDLTGYRVRLDAEGRALRIEPESTAEGDNTWADGFYAPGVNGNVYALATFGGELFVGGNFSIAGSVSASRIARWNGTEWLALGAGVNGDVLSLTVFPPPPAAGGSLIVGGSFTTADGVARNHIASWDLSGWGDVGSLSGSVRSLTAYQGLLVAAGDFTGGVARWDGSNWVHLGAADLGLNGVGRCLTQYLGHLIVGGDFTGITGGGGPNLRGIARWTGAAWLSMSGGFNVGSSTPSVRALVDFFPGGSSQHQLLAGGVFATAGTPAVSVGNIARFDSTSTWKALIGATGGVNNEVHALNVYNGSLFIGGKFTSTTSGLAASHIVAWNGAAWDSTGSGTRGPGNVEALLTLGSDLWVGGSFDNAGGLAALNVARWSGTLWNNLDGNGMGGEVRALTLYGGSLIAGGTFQTAGGVLARAIARWDGTAWQTLGSGMAFAQAPEVDALCVYPASTGDLYAGGKFTSAGGVPALNIARWNGSSWSALGSGLDNTVRALAVYGTELVAGGDFTASGVTALSRLARWNAFTWTGVTNGVDDSVYSLLPFGSDLIVGGKFQKVNGVTNPWIARWNSGSGWGSLGGIGFNGPVYALLGFHTELYAGGSFSLPGPNLVRRDSGGVWNLVPGVPDTVRTLAVYHDSLTVGGHFRTTDGAVGNYVIRGVNGAWVPLGSGTDAPVLSLQEFKFEQMVGGMFIHAGGKVSLCIAERRDQSVGGVGEPLGPLQSLRWRSAIPNPFLSEVQLNLESAGTRALRIEIFDLSGRLVRRLFEGAVTSPGWSWTWDGRDDRGRPTPPGVYFLRARAADGTAVQRVIRLGH